MSGKALADELCVYDETIDSTKPHYFRSRCNMEDKDAYRLHSKRTSCNGIQNGELVYKQPSLYEIRIYCAEQLETLWDEVFQNPILTMWICQEAVGY
ncbi:MAG: hypothetical protein ACLS48_06605 [[Eubacterium] siraeum]